jgi:hypothetical protein
MPGVYSRLTDFLGRRRISDAALSDTLREHRLTISPRTLNRLKRGDQPLTSAEEQALAKIAQALGVPVTQLMTPPLPGRLRKLSAAAQDRLDELMSKNNEGQLTTAERSELKALVVEAQRLAVLNARSLLDGNGQPTTDDGGGRGTKSPKKGSRPRPKASRAAGRESV